MFRMEPLGSCVRVLFIKAMHWKTYHWDVNHFAETLEHILSTLPGSPRVAVELLLMIPEGNLKHLRVLLVGNLDRLTRIDPRWTADTWEELLCVNEMPGTAVFAIKE